MPDAPLPARPPDPPPWSPYVAWAKTTAWGPHDLATSNLLHLVPGELPGAEEVLLGLGRPRGSGPTLRGALAARYGTDEARVALSCGASGGTFLALGALTRPGGTVLVESPGYDPHPGAARFLGARVRTFPRPTEDGFRLDPDAVAAALDDDVDVVLLTNLHNPTGVWTDPDALAEVGARAEAAGARVVVDEVYLETARDVDTRPAALLHPALVSVSSLSKAFGLSGTRVGWVLADPETAEAVRRVRDVVDGVGSEPMERLGALAVTEMDRLLERARAHLAANTALLRDFVEGRAELTWTPPADGCPVAAVRLVGEEDADAFAERALRDHGVKVVPGRFFGLPDHLRLAVAGPTEAVRAALEALGRALDAEAV